MKRITAHIKTGDKLVQQQLEMKDGVDPITLTEYTHVEFDSPSRGKVLIRVADVAFWTYD